jgi:hypothetical protein
MPTFNTSDEPRSGKADEPGNRIDDELKPPPYERSLERQSRGRESSTEITAPGVPQWLTSLLQGITLTAIIGFAFWLGTLSGTVNRSAEKVDKLSDAMIGPSRESVSNRLSVIETKLDSLDKRLEQPTKTTTP